jgi:hypothetical protein
MSNFSPNSFQPPRLLILWENLVSLEWSRLQNLGIIIIITITTNTIIITTNTSSSGT